MLVLSVFSGLQGLWIVRQQIFDNPKRLLRFLLPALIVASRWASIVLALLIPLSLKTLIGLFMLFYGGFFALRADLPVLTSARPVIDRWLD